jgi:hypothetical protein
VPFCSPLTGVEWEVPPVVTKVATMEPKGMFGDSA